MTKISACTCMFLIIIPGRFLIEWLPYINMGTISTILVGLSYLFMAICLLDNHSNFKKSLNKDGKNLLFLYISYSLFIFYYLFITPQLDLAEMAHVPKSIESYLQSSISIGVPIYLANYCKEKVDFLFFAKFSTLFIIFLLIVYFLKVDFNNYITLRLMHGEQRDEFVENQGLIAPSTLGRHVITAYVCNLWIGKRWSKSSLINDSIFYTIFIVLVSCLMLFAERGPILFTISTTLFFYFSKSKQLSKYILISLITIFLIVVFSDYIISFLTPIFGHTFERFSTIIEDGGSGRFGGEDSVYGTSLEQIQNGLLWGSYPRIVSHNWMDGMYPHNLFLEILMSLGIVFGIPLCWLMIKAVFKSFHAIRYRDPESLFCLLFICYSSCLLTSGTIMLHRHFWITFAITLSVKTIKRSNFLIRPSQAKSNILNFK